jgi:hypothetical protein
VSGQARRRINDSGASIELSGLFIQNLVKICKSRPRRITHVIDVICEKMGGQQQAFQKGRREGGPCPCLEKRLTSESDLLVVRRIRFFIHTLSGFEVVRLDS